MPFKCLKIPQEKFNKLCFSLRLGKFGQIFVFNLLLNVKEKVILKRINVSFIHT